MKERLVTGNGNDEITGGRPDSFCGIRALQCCLA